MDANSKNTTRNFLINNKDLIKITALERKAKLPRSLLSQIIMPNGRDMDFINEYMILKNLKVLAQEIDKLLLERHLDKHDFPKPIIFK